MDTSHVEYIRRTPLATLSICIPTFNRSKYIAELLDSIVEENDPDLEIIISDDASTDDTKEVVGMFNGRIKSLKFIERPKNIGIDANFLAVIGEASGEYAWLFGDDDKLEPGAIKKVLSALKGWPGIAGMTVGVIDYDPELRRPTGIRHMPPTARLSGTETVFTALAEHLGFMSALIVNRRMWNTVCQEYAVLDFKNFYIQVYIIGKMVERFGDWGVLNSPCVRFRTSNDQFLSKFGWLDRIRIDILAYDQIFSAIFEHNPRVVASLRHRILTTHVLSRVRNAKTSPDSNLEIWPTVILLFKHYRDVPAFWHSAIPTLLVPKWALRGLRAAYQRYSRSSGTQRVKTLVSQMGDQ
jgi:abequosyltransferase